MDTSFHEKSELNVKIELSSAYYHIMLDDEAQGIMRQNINWTSNYFDYIKEKVHPEWQPEQ